MSDFQMTVRQATSAQARELAGLRWEWAHREGPVPAEAKWEQFASAFTQWMHDHEDSHLAFIAEDGPQVIGMAWLAWLPRVPDPTKFNRVGADLQSVYVKPAWRGNGAGISLVQAVIAYAASRSGHVTVRTGRSATSFYPQLGFAVNTTSLERQLP